jgi:DNA topoisomerase IA
MKASHRRRDGRPHHLHAYRRRADGARAYAAARSAIGRNYGKEYLPDVPRRYTSKAKNAQEAHEAIRPTDFSRRPGDVAAMSPTRRGSTS